MYIQFTNNFIDIYNRHSEGNTWFTHCHSVFFCCCFRREDNTLVSQ